MELSVAEKMFKGKKVTLMGLGLLGRGIGDARFFAEAGAELIITDLKTEQDLAQSIAKLTGFPNITYHLGGHRMEDFEGRDLILKAPNAPLDSPFIAHGREQGIPIEMDAALFSKLSSATTVGITGTRGKSTTTHLISEMAKAAGTGTADRNIFLGGNERDTATLPLLGEAKDNDLVILELDSWQLQGFEEDKISPHIAVWTNFMPDHMNYYHGNMDRYFQDKAAIARFQRSGDFFIAPQDIKERIKARFGPLAGRSIEPTPLPATWRIALPGEHNRANAAAAAAAARCLGISDDIIKGALERFSGLPGRMELLGEKHGIAFYNDSNSTTPDAGIAALKALGGMHRPIVLIAGGSDKELDFGTFAREIEQSAKSVILFNGKATDKIAALLPKKLISATASTMRDACIAAMTSASSGDAILLSPGATSFGLFKNEYDRGDQFKAWFNEQ